MITSSSQYKPPGYRGRIHYDSIRNRPIDPPQPVLVLREATREEFLAYWQSTGVPIDDSPPLDYFYQEVSTD